ncbi:hypothetical protein CGCA056_v004397 [Colletotrichum aenigma]|uniref:uncharacterized protein n=1 Tax=Colletotrichum aenigma TaxID=1215731 RepID=UPI0018727F76|nr:uncharacterized protein CGCA056_v004397 [Colletotrichum aenigma]KAF5523867.1 hypothetical protein CGCA056_v004397 [Colletotrichum aenigma]
MRTANLALAVGALSGVSVAKELEPNAELSAWYETGAAHQESMEHKLAQWKEFEVEGRFESAKWTARPKDYIACKDGKVELVKGDPLQTFRCKDLDLYDFQSHATLGNSTGRGSGSWGWTAPNGREFFAVGQYDGAAFVEISKQGKLIYLGRLPQYSVPSQWREIKTYKNYLVVGSEAVDHGVQFFDLRKLKLLDIDPKNPITFSQSDLTAHWSEALPLGRSHNVVVNEEKGYAVAVGAQPRKNLPCDSGLQFLDLADIANPQYLGCAAGDGYVHDAQCIVYRGPDVKYWGRDICYGYNENTLTIYDVTDKNTTNIISRTSYEGATYTHQGWIIDPNWQDFLVLDDEIDERNKTGPAADGFPVTYFWDIRSLASPRQTGIFKGTVRSVDHNQYINRGLSYQSNYGAGLRILDISSIRKDPTAKGVKEIAYFDIYPEDDQEEGGGLNNYVGTWSHYPFFKSGYIVINTMERGVWVVKRSNPWWWPW